MGRIWFVPVLLATWVCGTGTVHACSCTSRSTRCGPPGDFWRASDVFTARVDTIQRGSRSTERLVNVQVIERFRGAVAGAGGRTVVLTRSSSLCGYPFKAGRAYLIYGFRSEDGRLATSICSRTAPIERAAEDLDYARGAMNGIVPAGRIVGDVRLKTIAHRSRGLPNVTVKLAAGGVVTSTVTDDSGHYTIELASAGRFELDVDVPDTQYALRPHSSIDVPHPQACVERNIDVAFNGRITGRIVEASGRGIAGLPVAHVPARATIDPEQRSTVLTRDDGTYDLERLSPGPFEIRIAMPVEAGEPEESVNDETNLVARGTLGEGKRQVVQTFTLPTTFHIVRLEGVVVGPDGWSLPDARVFLKGVSEARLIGVPAITDALGRFVLAVAADEQYYVFAERASGESEFSEPISITGEQRMAPLRLVVRRRF